MTSFVSIRTFANGEKGMLHHSPRDATAHLSAHESFPWRPEFPQVDDRLFSPFDLCSVFHRSGSQGIAHFILLKVFFFFALNTAREKKSNSSKKSVNRLLLMCSYPAAHWWIILLLKLGVFTRQVNSAVWTPNIQKNWKGRPTGGFLVRKMMEPFFSLDIRALKREYNVSRNVSSHYQDLSSHQLIIPSQRISTRRNVSVYSTTYAVVCEMVIRSPLCVSDFPLPTPLAVSHWSFLEKARPGKSLGPSAPAAAAPLASRTSRRSKRGGERSEPSRSAGKWVVRRESSVAADGSKDIRMRENSH